MTTEAKRARLEEIKERLRRQGYIGGDKLDFIISELESAWAENERVAEILENACRKHGLLPEANHDQR